ncbi:hypothetical protein HYY71_01570 [Candidatus Woesearchaeota archaeon]|nr:hypothetical protein [Candidatus Woesearchaeota archaeon]
MTSKEIEKQYSELRKKHKLPEFRELDFELEISDFEETSFLLRSIIRRICEKLDFYCTMLEEVLQPDTSNLYAMHETRAFDEQEKKQMYELYSKLMILNRRSIELSLGYNERDEADFIIDFAGKWASLKAELLNHVKKMKASWETETDTKEDVGYLG